MRTDQGDFLILLILFEGRPVSPPARILELQTVLRVEVVPLDLVHRTQILLLCNYGSQSFLPSNE